MPSTSNVLPHGMHLDGGQRPTLGSQLSPSSMWGPRDGTQVVPLDGKRLYPLSPLTGPLVHFEGSCFTSEQWGKSLEPFPLFIDV